MNEEFKPTHKGLMFGLVPVYLDMSNEECPCIEARHWILEIPLDICHAIFACCVFVMTAMDANYEPSFPIMITGEVRDGKVPNKPTPAPVPGNWIPWGGGKCPVDENALVEARMSTGKCVVARADCFYWHRMYPSDGTVEAYRLMHED